jgi:hypothetical protein
MITLKLFDGSGNILTSRKFKVNESFILNAYVTGALTIPAPFQSVRLEVPETGYVKDERTSWNGIVNYVLSFPAGSYTLNLTTTFPTGVESQSVPILVGAPESKTPKPITSTSEGGLIPQGFGLDKITTALAWGIGITVVGLGAYAAWRFTKH